MKFTKEGLAGLSACILAIGISLPGIKNDIELEKLAETSKKEELTYEELDNISYELKKRNEINEIYDNISGYLVLLSLTGFYLAYTEITIFKDDYDIEI